MSNSYIWQAEMQLVGPDWSCLAAKRVLAEGDSVHLKSGHSDTNISRLLFSCSHLHTRTRIHIPMTTRTPIMGTPTLQLARM
jgi:hypothetical protein